MFVQPQTFSRRNFETALKATVCLNTQLAPLGDSGYIKQKAAAFFNNETSLLNHGYNLNKLVSLFLDLMRTKCPFTANHSERVAAVANYLSATMALNQRTQEHIRIAAQLHDVGKLAIPTSILEKPTPLSPSELKEMRSHPLYTDRILRAFRVSDPIRRYAVYHHERPDGNGYPYGISGTAIPFEARIISVADVFVALTENRPYRKGMKTGSALVILMELADKGGLDKEVVQFLSMHLTVLQSICSAVTKRTQNASQHYPKTT